MLLKQSQTAKVIPFLLVLTSDHISPATGLTPTVTLSKNGAAFASPSGAVTEIANGWYKIAGNATDTGTLGSLLLHATGTGADPTDDRHEVVAYDPDDSVRLGLTALPNAAAGATGGLAPMVLRGGTAQAGAGGTITLDAGASATDDFYLLDYIHIVSGTGAGQARFISAYVGSTKVASVQGNWYVAPDSTSVFVIYPFGTAPAVQAVLGNVGGNLLGTLSTTERNAIADALLDRNMATGTDSGSPTVRTVRQALRALRNKFSFSGSTRTVFKEDDSTASWTSVVTTDAAAVPIVSDDPA